MVDKALARLINTSPLGVDAAVDIDLVKKLNSVAAED